MPERVKSSRVLVDLLVASGRRLRPSMREGAGAGGGAEVTREEGLGKDGAVLGQRVEGWHGAAGEGEGLFGQIGNIVMA